MSRGAPARRPPRERLRAARRPGPAERPRPAPRLCDSAAAAPAPGPAAPRSLHRPRTRKWARGAGAGPPHLGRVGASGPARGLAARPTASCSGGLGAGRPRAPPEPAWARGGGAQGRRPPPRKAKYPTGHPDPAVRAACAPGAGPGSGEGEGAGGLRFRAVPPGVGVLRAAPAPPRKANYPTGHLHPAVRAAPRAPRARPASEQPLTLGVCGAPRGFQAAHPDRQAPRSAPGLPATGPGYLLGDPEPPPPKSGRFRGAPAQEPSPAAK